MSPLTQLSQLPKVPTSIKNLRSRVKDRKLSPFKTPVITPNNLHWSIRQLNSKKA